jgi:hypothetical protein
MGLMGAPRFYVEIDLIYASTFGAFRAAPVYVELREASDAIPATTPRDVTMTLIFARNGVVAGAVAVPIARAITARTRLTPDLLAGQSSPWVPVARQEGDEADEGWLLRAPFGVQATLVESAAPNGVDLLLARLFALTRPGVSAIAKSSVTTGAEDVAEPSNE